MQLTASAANALGNLEIFDVGGSCHVAPNSDTLKRTLEADLAGYGSIRYAARPVARMP